MADPTFTPIDRLLTGETLFAGDYTLQPTARVRGGRWGAPTLRGQGAYLRLQPTAVRVTDPAGVETTIALTNPGAQALRSMWAGVAAIAGLSSLIMLAARLWRRRRG